MGPGKFQILYSKIGEPLSPCRAVTGGGDSAVMALLGSSHQYPSKKKMGVSDLIGGSNNLGFGASLPAAPDKSEFPLLT